MKKLILLVLVAIMATSCATTKRGYDYKAHQKRSQQFKKHAGCWH
jgi:hypothetical protein